MENLKRLRDAKLLREAVGYFELADIFAFNTGLYCKFMIRVISTLSKINNDPVIFDKMFRFVEKEARL